MILLEQTKTRKERYVFFSKTQIDLIKELIDRQPKREYLFWNFLKKRRLNKNDVKLFNRNMRDKLGLRVFYSRQMRKTMATDLAKYTKGDLKMIQTILGHTDIKMTQIYVEYSTDQARDVYMLVEDKIFNKIGNNT
jgi:integrase